MSESLIHDHHLKHFTDPVEAARYTCELRPAILNANWRLLGAALADRNLCALRFSIETEDDGPGFLSGITAIDPDGGETSFADIQADLITTAIMQTDDRISVGAAALDWPLEIRLAIQARDYLDLNHPDWSAPGSPAATLILDTDGQVYFTPNDGALDGLE